jgi:taurine dioxygenase
MSVQFEPINDVLGARVVDFDMSAPLDEDAFLKIRRALAEHTLLLFRDQGHIAPADQIAFSRRFGPLEEHVLTQFLFPGHPEIFVVSNIVENGRHIGAYGGAQDFHSDLAYMQEPSLGSVFRCLECPDEGGETAFANMYAAYDALPDAMRHRVDKLNAVYDYVWSYERRLAPLRGPLSPEQKAKTPVVVHPLVRTHPETGRNGLFLSFNFIRRFEGMSEDESQKLVHELVEFATQSRFSYTHKWRPGDIVMWDNRNSMHKACPFDSKGTRRLMHRTTIRGDAPFRGNRSKAAA